MCSREDGAPPTAGLAARDGEGFYSSIYAATCCEHVFKRGKGKNIWMLQFSFRNCSFIEIEMFQSIMTTMLAFFAHGSC